MANTGIAVPAVQPWGTCPRAPASTSPPATATDYQEMNLRPGCPGSQGHSGDGGGLITLTLR
jgi:hypothetical protein